MSEQQIVYLTDRIFALERHRDRQRMLGKLSQKDAEGYAIEIGLLREELRLRIREMKVERR